MPTVSTENYLKTIYLLEEEEEGRVSTKAISAALGVSQASVTGMIQVLSEGEFVDYEKYKGVRLTSRGRLMALNVIRKHRLVEQLLVEIFDYGWEEVHDEAERLEHAISDRLAEAIDRLLGYPNYDPHGDPIPSSCGELPKRETITLGMMKEGERGHLARVVSNNREVLRYLDGLGLMIGVGIQMESVVELDGQMEVVVEGGARVTVSRMIGSLLRVVLA